MSLEPVQPLIDALHLNRVLTQINSRHTDPPYDGAPDAVGVLTDCLISAHCSELSSRRDPIYHYRIRLGYRVSLGRAHA